MINHLGKYNDAQAIQDALDAGTLANPYVAMTSAGTIDYNSLQPTPPAPSTMGVWSDDGQGVYTFQVLDAEAIGQISQTDNVLIGSLDGVWTEGTEVNMNVELAYDDIGGMWWLYLTGEGLTTEHAYSFYDDTQDAWNDEGIMTEQDSSSASLQVYWDGVDTFVFQRNPAGSGAALQMTTIDPPYPAGE